MAGPPGAAGLLVAALDMLSTDVDFHVQLSIKGADGNEGGPDGVQLPL